MEGGAGYLIRDTGKGEEWVLPCQYLTQKSFDVPIDKNACLRI